MSNNTPIMVLYVSFNARIRIVRINGDKVITKRDANFKEDDFITKDKILGKVMIHGKLLNAFVSYLCYIIIAYTMTYLVAQLFPNYKRLE